MIGLIHDIFNIADRYGLKILNIDTTDVTLMARIEILPNISIQLYRNTRKDKLNMALILGNDRVYGVDGEGGLYHEHPAEDPTTHRPIKERFEIEFAEYPGISLCVALSSGTAAMHLECKYILLDNVT